MRLYDIVNGKTYPIIQYRMTLRLPGADKLDDILVGYCQFTDNELKSLDGDTYSLFDRLDKYEERTVTEDWMYKDTDEEPLLKKGEKLLVVWESDGLPN